MFSAQHGGILFREPVAFIPSPGRLRSSSTGAGSGDELAASSLGRILPVSWGIRVSRVIPGYAAKIHGGKYPVIGRCVILTLQKTPEIGTLEPS